MDEFKHITREYIVIHLNDEFYLRHSSNAPHTNEEIIAKNLIYEEARRLIKDLDEIKELLKS